MRKAMESTHAEGRGRATWRAGLPDARGGSFIEHLVLVGVVAVIVWCQIEKPDRVVVTDV